MKFDLKFIAFWLDKILKEHPLEISETASDKIRDVISEVSGMHQHWKLSLRPSIIKKWRFDMKMSLEIQFDEWIIIQKALETHAFLLEEKKDHKGVAEFRLSFTGGLSDKEQSDLRKLKNFLMDKTDTKSEVIQRPEST